MEDIVIMGAEGLAREVAFVIEEINRISPTWRISGFVKAERQYVGTPVGKYSVSCTDDDRWQFAQLIGYSVSAGGGLSYADESQTEAADQAVTLLSKLALSEAHVVELEAKQADTPEQTSDRAPQPVAIIGGPRCPRFDALCLRM